MAQNLQLLKRRIKTSNNISQIAKAMEMISASKIKRAQVAAANNKPYAKRITEMTQSIISEIGKDKVQHPYLTQRNGKRNLYIALSPDKGLCGSLNTNLYKKLLEITDKNAQVVTIGKKIGAFAAKINFELVASYPMSSSLPDYSFVYQLKKIIQDGIDNNSINKVFILYPDFQSLFTQIPVIEQLLPLEIEETPIEKTTLDHSLFEPTADKLLNELLPYYLEIKLFNALLQNFTSEQAARMMAMQNAKNNARDIAQYLTLVYNKSRQERITNEILDLANSKQL